MFNNDWSEIFVGSDGSRVLAAPSSSRHAGIRAVVDADGTVSSTYIQGADGWWRLHSVDGRPSTKMDGRPVYHLHGVQVPRWLAAVAVADAAARDAAVRRILGLESAEQRRVGLTLLSPGALSGMVAATLDAAQRSDGGIEAVVRLRDGSHWLVADDGSTGRVYWLTLAPEITTVSAAQSALYGIPSDLQGDRS